MSTLIKEKPADAILVIDARAKLYAEQRDVLFDHVTAYKFALEQLRRQFLPVIRKTAARCADLQDNLHHEIKARPDLFEKPRTMTLHGIKLGFGKGRGVVEWTAEDEVIVERIRKFCPEDQHETLIKTTHKPVITALQLLDGKLLQKLGVTVESTGDCVIIKAANTEVDKLVAKILKEGSQPEEKEAA